MKLNTFFPYLAIPVILLIFGCSGATAPTGPVVPDIPDLTTQNSQPAETSESPGHYLWGYYDIYVNPAELEFEIVPLRQAEGHWNVLKWLEQGPCTDCFSIVHAEPSGTGTILVQIAVKHPFPSANLTGFDVRGIAMFNGSHNFPVADVMMSDRSTGEGEVVNADGYTTLYNPGTEGSGPGGLQGYIKGNFGTITYPSSTLNAYKRFISDDPLNTRNAFYSGETIIVEYEVDMPGAPFVFGYAVDANWAPPTTKPVTDPMMDFGPDANCPEPWKIDTVVDPIGDGLHNYGGSALVSMSVYDWQGKDTHDSPKLECSELFDNVVIAEFVSDGTGYSVFEVTVENDKHAPVGSYRCLIYVEDDANETAPEWLDLTAYQVVTLEVTEFANEFPVAAATANPNPQEAGEPVQFDDDGSYDPDGGLIVKYEWDWENDGTFDEEGANVEYSWASPGTYTVQFRVTDEEDTSSTLTIPLSIEIIPAEDPPIAIAVADPNPQTVCEVVNFEDDGSYDPDGGTIQLYEWDWDNDGTFDEEGSNVSHTWDVPGTYEVQFRVTDDEGISDTLDEPLSVEIENALPTADAFVYHFPFDSKITVTTTVNFNGTDSIDSDCQDMYITSWEWDWENDGIFDDTGAIKSHIFDTVGHYDVQLRVTDDEGGTDTLDEPLGIDVVYSGWAITFGTENGDAKIYDVAADSEGNVYCTGYTWYETDFDPGSGTSEPSDKGIFIAAYDHAGRYRWSHSWNTNGSPDAGCGITVDNSGYVYVTGYFAGTKDFDPGDGVDNHIADGWDAFVLKFDSDGNYVWGQTWGHTGYDRGYSISVGSGGNVYVAGTFQDSVDFDPSISESYWLTASGHQDSFLSAFDSSGNFLWANGWGGNDPDPQYDYAYGVAADLSGNVYVTGQFYGTADFDPGAGTTNLTSSGTIDGYLASYMASNGSLIWAKAISSTNNYDQGHGVTVDASGYVYVTGRFQNTVDFDFGAGTQNRTAIGFQDAFLACYYYNSTYQWVQTWGDAVTYTNGNDVCLTTDGHLALTGIFEGTVDFDPGIGHSDWTSNGNDDVFVCYLSTGGIFGWAKAWGGSDEDCGYGACSDASGNIFVGGSFLGTVDFDPSAGTDEHTPPAVWDGAFISKFLPDGTW